MVADAVAMLMVIRGQRPVVNTFTADQIRDLAGRYEDRVPLATVEQANLETFPRALEEGALRWRDIEWPVRWYYRRHLSSRYNDRRQATEAAFRDNEWPTVRETVLDAVDRDEPDQRVRTLTSLAGVDVGVASAILYVADPDRDIVMGTPEWRALADAGVLDGDLPDDPTPVTYARYHGACVDLVSHGDLSLDTLQRALWVSAHDED